MFKHTSGRLFYLWLAIAVALHMFNGARWAIPLAAWLAPVFLLHLVRAQRPLPGFLLAWLVKSVGAAVALQGWIPIPGVFYYVFVLLTTLVATLPYLADRLITARLQGFAATLVFPLAFTTYEFLSSLGPFGAFTSIANSQYGDLPLMQLVSVTGVWGITFLIIWFAAVVNWAWEREFAWPEVRSGAALYAGVLAVVLLGGGARLVLSSADATTVRVAAISPSQSAVAALNQQLSPDKLMTLLSGNATPSDRALAGSAYGRVADDLLTRTQQEARAGAKIVVWPEVGTSVLQEDEPGLIQRASALAKQEGIYLDMGLAVLLSSGDKPPVMDEAVLIDPTGNVAWTYEKTHLVPFGEQGVVVQGHGSVPMAASPYGRLAGVICFDLDFPGLIRQAGRAGADLMLAPSNDWQAVDPAHTHAATFRAIENGFSLVRQASNGLSMAVDYEGRVQAASDYFSTDQQVMVADVPMHGVRTIYAAIGDLFAWLCVFGLVVLTGLAILQSRQRRSAAAGVAPLPEASHIS